jgi:hypothetical protein
LKAILEEAAHQGFVLGEGDHAVADVAGREHAIFAAQATRATAVVGDGDDGGQVGDGTFFGDGLIAGASDVFFKAAEKRREAGAAAECDDFQAARDFCVPGLRWFQVRLGNRIGDLILPQRLKPIWWPKINGTTEDLDALIRCICDAGAQRLKPICCPNINDTTEVVP